MGVSLTELIEALRMASELPWHVALPIYLVAYGVSSLVLIGVVNAGIRTYRLWREALKK